MLRQIILILGFVVVPLGAQTLTPPTATYPPYYPPALLEKAKAGNAAAIYDLCRLIFSEYENPLSDDDSYWEEELENRLPEQAEKGDPDAMARLSRGYLTKPPTTEFAGLRAKGWDYLKRAAEAGSLFALTDIQRVYAHGDGEFEKNQEAWSALLQKVFPLVQKRMEAGDAEALYEASRLRLSPMGVTDDQQIAWRAQAANLGHRDALFEMGEENEDNGRYNEALDFYERAAEKGDWRGPLNAAFLVRAGLVDVEGMAGHNPEAARKKADELAILAEANLGYRNTDMLKYWSPEEEVGDFEEDGTPIAMKVAAPRKVLKIQKSTPKKKVPSKSNKARVKSQDHNKKVK